MGNFPGGAGPGRPKGSVNKTTALLKDAILKAAEAAGENLSGEDESGLVRYLQAQAIATPGPFMALLGKVLPMQISGDPDSPLIHTIERIIVDGRGQAANPDSAGVPAAVEAKPL